MSFLIAPTFKICDFFIQLGIVLSVLYYSCSFQYGEENVTKVVNNSMEASQDDNVEESKSQDCELYVISKEKTEKQQMIIDRQQTHTEV